MVEELMKIEIIRINNTLKRALGISGERDLDLQEVVRYGLFNLVSLEQANKKGIESNCHKSIELIAMFFDNLAKVYLMASGRQYYVRDKEKALKNIDDMDKIRNILAKELFTLMQDLTNF